MSGDREGWVGVEQALVHLGLRVVETIKEQYPSDGKGLPFRDANAILAIIGMARDLGLLGEEAKP